MITRPEPACLVIADITGYTSYLAGVELDHAQDILADLVDTVVRSLRPTLRLSKLEGDAAFAYVLAETVDGSLLQDTIEASYFAFRRRLRDIGQASRCECNACILIPRLDLKFAVHHGLVVRQRMAGREELVGSDVIIVHRLLKNSVADVLGGHAYVLYTDACIRAMGVDPLKQGMAQHRETIDVIGEVTVWTRDLQEAWESDESRRRLVVGPDEAMETWQRVIEAPPPLVWEFLTSPFHRPRWQDGVLAIREQAASGRRGPGTINHCVHGRDMIVEEIVDWRPYEHLTTRYQMPTEGFPKLVISNVLESVPEGTRVTMRIARPRSAKDRAAVDTILPDLGLSIEAGLVALRHTVLDAVAARAADGGPEPPVPRSEGRNLREPVAPGAGTVDSGGGRSSLS